MTDRLSAGAAQPAPKHRDVMVASGAGSGRKIHEAYQRSGAIKPQRTVGEAARG
jgi:hypothetical protein